MMEEVRRRRVKGRKEKRSNGMEEKRSGTVEEKRSARVEREEECEGGREEEWRVERRGVVKETSLSFSLCFVFSFKERKDCVRLSSILPLTTREDFNRERKKMHTGQRTWKSEENETTPSPNAMMKNPWFVLFRSVRLGRRASGEESRLRKHERERERGEERGERG
jgi:hypothetical protein